MWEKCWRHLKCLEWRLNKRLLKAAVNIDFKPSISGLFKVIIILSNIGPNIQRLACSSWKPAKCLTLLCHSSLKIPILLTDVTLKPDTDDFLCNLRPKTFFQKPAKQLKTNHCLHVSVYQSPCCVWLHQGGQTFWLVGHDGICNLTEGLQ